MARLLMVALATAWLSAIVPFGCGSSEDCRSGQDEDGDGLVGCADPDCWSAGLCPEDCRSGSDEDGDGLVSCADPDCWSAGLCPERCDGASDADGDGLVGCDDDDCWVVGGGCSERCEGGGDEDGDGAVDCADDDCWVVGGACREACEGGDDEDADGAVDCDDPDCATDAACAPTYSEEVRPILLTHCVGGGGACHSSDNALGGLSVETYADLPKPSIYCPGQTKGWCSLFRILEPSMPQDCLGCVPPADVALLERWVAAGIPE